MTIDRYTIDEREAIKWADGITTISYSIVENPKNFTPTTCEAVQRLNAHHARVAADKAERKIRGIDRKSLSGGDR